MRKNMIMLPAKHETSIGFCGNSQHSVVQGFYQKYGAHNGIIGPGSHREKWVESIYFCQLCGVTFQPTLRNCLQNGEKERYEKAVGLFNNTFPATLKRNLRVGEVFKELTLTGGDPAKISFLRKDEINGFEANALIRVFDVNEKTHDPLVGKPYILPDDGTFRSEVIFWAPWKYEKVPLSNKEKNKIKERARLAKKDSRNVSKTALIEEKLMEGASHIVQEKSKPLPKGAVPATRIFLIGGHSDAVYYIPENAYTAVK
jgi:hypothetical protein